MKTMGGRVLQERAVVSHAPPTCRQGATRRTLTAHGAATELLGERFGQSQLDEGDCDRRRRRRRRRAVGGGGLSGLGCVGGVGGVSGSRHLLGGGCSHCGGSGLGGWHTVFVQGSHPEQPLQCARCALAQRFVKLDVLGQKRPHKRRRRRGRRRGRRRRGRRRLARGLWCSGGLASGGLVSGGGLDCRQWWWRRRRVGRRLESPKRAPERRVGQLLERAGGRLRRLECAEQADQQPVGKAACDRSGAAESMREPLEIGNAQVGRSLERAVALSLRPRARHLVHWGLLLLLLLSLGRLLLTFLDDVLALGRPHRILDGCEAHAHVLEQHDVALGPAFLVARNRAKLLQRHAHVCGAQFVGIRVLRRRALVRCAVHLHR